MVQRALNRRVDGVVVATVSGKWRKYEGADDDEDDSMKINIY